uniref:Uncharacterized protein n=1 Tax=Arundo donax TaxID=35708 RepID=A0A0A9APB4_ARUDO
MRPVIITCAYACIISCSIIFPVYLSFCDSDPVVV